MKRFLLDILSGMSFIFILWFINYLFFGNNIRSVELIPSAAAYTELPSPSFEVEGNFVYYKYNYDYSLIENVDIETFQILDNFYAKDKNFVYFKEKNMEEIDPESFEIICCGYSKDKNSIYYNATKLSGIDSESFIFLSDMYQQDKNFVYYYRKPLSFVDVKTFKPLGVYSKDKNNIYYHDGIVANADIETFDVLGEGYAKDKNSIYVRGKKLEEANVSSFLVLSHGYSRDDSFVYYYGKKLEEVDVTSFKFISMPHNVIGYPDSCPYLKDSTGFYNRGEKVRSLGDFDSWCKRPSFFFDIEDYKQYYSSVTDLHFKNILNGYNINGKKYFKPENTINRAEFMKIVLLAKYTQEEIDVAPSAGFTDIPAGEWYENYANFGKEKGFIRGYEQPDGTFTFGGTQNISFAEAAKIVVNILIEPTDSSTTGNWYDSFVEKLQKKNVHTYLPEKNITRGEMAEIISDILN
jgi:hypothetical protein